MEVKGQPSGLWVGSAGRLPIFWQKWSECTFAGAELAPGEQVERAKLCMLRAFPQLYLAEKCRLLPLEG